MGKERGGSPHFSASSFFQSHACLHTATLTGCLSARHKTAMPGLLPGILHSCSLANSPFTATSYLIRFVGHLFSPTMVLTGPFTDVQFIYPSLLSSSEILRGIWLCTLIHCQQPSAMLLAAALSRTLSLLLTHSSPSCSEGESHLECLQALRARPLAMEAPCSRRQEKLPKV